MPTLRDSIDRLCAERQIAEAARLEELRALILDDIGARGWSQSRCARELGVSPQYVTSTLREGSWTQLVTLGRRVAAL